jgi:hypothetical protein
MACLYCVYTVIWQELNSNHIQHSLSVLSYCLAAVNIYQAFTFTDYQALSLALVVVVGWGGGPTNNLVYPNYS